MDSKDVSPSSVEPPSRNTIVAIIVIALLLLIFLIGLLVALRPASIHVVNCPQTAPSAPQSADGHFVDKQVIVIGPRAQIDQVIQSPTTTAVISGPLVPGCPLDYLGQVFYPLGQSPASNLFQPEDLQTLEVRLYEIQSNTTVTQAVEAINAEGARTRQRVYADPNYLTIGMVDAESCGNPNGAGGSPNGAGGSPNGAGGSSLGSGVPVSATDYASQWAFEHIGLGAALDASYDAAKVDYQGDRVRVGLFDTSPFTETQLQTATQGLGNVVTFAAPITWVTPAFTLTVVVSPLQSLSIASAPSITAVHAISDVSDHGLFVAGLVHAVAPKSDIQLYPVLDQYACGNLYTLVTRLNTFISQVEADRRQGLLNGAVINLSLGVLQPRATEAFTRTVVPTQTSETTGYAFVTASTPDDQLQQALTITNPVESLLLTLNAADQLNITVVAAAGNGSWRDEYQARPLGPDLPAAYPFVIGVAGSNADRQRSCFSNWGNVSAPAGEGAPGEVPVVSGTEIISVTTSCAVSFETPLISVVTNNTGRFPNRYATWNGTSFATPLVSGLAALVLDAGAQQGTSWMQPRDVARAIKCGAAAYEGVINVPITLMRCMGP